MIAVHGGRSHGGYATHAEDGGIFYREEKMPARVFAESRRDRGDGPVKVLMEGGVWKVPPKKRPKLKHPKLRVRRTR